MEAAINQTKTLTGPRGLDLVRWGARIKNNPLKTYVDLHRAFGDMVWLPWPGKRCLFVYHPDHIAYFMKENHTNFVKGDQYKELKPLLGEGLLTSEGDLWRSQRRIMARQFHAPAIADYAKTILKLSEKQLDLTEGHHDVSVIFNRLALDLAGKIFFGADVDHFSELISKGLTYEMEKVNMRMRSAFSFPLVVPTPENLRRRWFLGGMEKVVREIMRNPGTGKTNVLSSLMKNENMPTRQIRDEVITLLMAGHETTSNLLTWITWYLALYPSWQKEIREEIKLQGKSPKLKAVIDETLRMMPPVPAIARMSVNPDVIDGFEIPAGVTIVAQPWVTQKDERWWKDPYTWNPERFIGRPERRDDFTYFPFARGPRSCIGEELARTETVIIMSVLLQRFEWTLEPGFVPEPVHHLTLQSKNGMELVLRKVPV